MVELSIDLLMLLSINRITNFKESPIWILKVEKIEKNRKYFLKVYLLKNQDIGKIDSIDFYIKELNEVYNINLFKESDQFYNPNVLGCVISLSKSISDLSNISIQSIKSELSTYNFKNCNSEIITFYKDDYHINRIQVLNSINNNYICFPEEDNKNWICKCGKINNLTIESCVNCKTKKSHLFRNISQFRHFNEFILREYIEKIDSFDISLNFDENLKRKFEKFNDFDYVTFLNTNLKEELLAKFNSQIHEYITEFKRKNQIIFSPSKSFQANLDDYYKKTKLEKSYFKDVFNDSELDELKNKYEMNLDLEKRKINKIKNLSLILSIIVLILIVLSQTILKPVINNYILMVEQRNYSQVVDKWNGEWCVIEETSASYSYENCIVIDIESKKVKFILKKGYTDNT